MGHRAGSRKQCGLGLCLEVQSGGNLRSNFSPSGAIAEEQGEKQNKFPVLIPQSPFPSNKQHKAAASILATVLHCL